MPQGKVFVHLSEGGATTNEIFLDWCKWLVKRLRTNSSHLPFILILDNLAAHVNQTTVDFLKRNNVRVLHLPPWTTHFLQPLDVLLFRLFKIQLDKAIWLRVAQRRKLLFKDDLSTVVHEAWNKVSPQSVKRSFSIPHLFPFDGEKLKALIYKKTFVVDVDLDNSPAPFQVSADGVVRRCSLLEWRDSTALRIPTSTKREDRVYVTLKHGAVDLQELENLTQQKLEERRRKRRRAKRSK